MVLYYIHPDEYFRVPLSPPPSVVVTWVSPLSPQPWVFPHPATLRWGCWVEPYSLSEVVWFDTWEVGGGVLLYNPCGADNLPDSRFYLGSATVLPHSTRIAAAGWRRIMALVEMGYRGKRDITLPLAAFYLSTYELDISR